MNTDNCSCVTNEDGGSVRFDDNVSVMAASMAEKTSIGSSCSFRARAKPYLALSTDSISIDLEDKPPPTKKSQAAILRSQFFHSTFNNTEIKPTTKSLDEKTIIEVSDEALDKGDTGVNKVLQSKAVSSCSVFESSKL